MLNEYRVRIPVRKTVEFIIKANSEEEAIEIGRENSLNKNVTGGRWIASMEEKADKDAPVMCDFICSCSENTREQVLLEVIRAGGGNYREAMYCYEHKKSLMDFDGWTHLQSVIGVLVSYEEYSRIAENLEGDIMDCTEEDTILLLRQLARMRC